MPKRKLKGKVVSNKMQKTVVVAVETARNHPVYGKLVRRTKRYKVRDEHSTNVGDEVVIEETRPLSKHVKWQVVEVLEN